MGMLVLPPFCALMAAAAGLRDAAPFVALAGGGVAGIACGTLLALHFARTTEGRVVLGFLLSIVFVVVCITASSFGCLAGGYRFDLR